MTESDRRISDIQGGQRRRGKSAGTVEDGCEQKLEKEKRGLWYR